MLNIKSILHPTDYSIHSETAFRIACALARDYEARVVVLHVAPLPAIGDAGLAVIPPPPDFNKEELETQLLQVQASDPGTRIEHRLERGEASAKILAVAQAIPCELIIMGTHGRTGLGRLLMGSVAEEVLRNAPCPVLTVKSPIPETPPGDLVTVYTLHDPIRAELIKAALQRENISCLLAGIQQASAVGLPGTTILVQAPAASAEHARELILAWEKKPVSQGRTFSTQDVG